ncbi:putative reverse transcriptase, RNA-dependent DNA polymerase, LTR copia-type gag-polypeptide [Tanacetum coccineum]
MVSQQMSYIKWRLLKLTLQAPFLNVQMMFVHISSGLVLHQMTSAHNRSELKIHVHNNEPSSSKLVPKVVPLVVKTATSRQELELLFHHHIAMLRTTGINPMIQPEPEDLPKDNPKLEIAVLRCGDPSRLITDAEIEERAGVKKESVLLSYVSDRRMTWSSYWNQNAYSVHWIKQDCRFTLESECIFDKTQKPLYFNPKVLARALRRNGNHLQSLMTIYHKDHWPMKLTRVTRISNGPSDVTVTVEGGRTFVAHDVVITIPIGVLKANLVEFEP